MAKASTGSRATQNRRKWGLWRLAGLAILIGSVAFAGYLIVLDARVATRISGRMWDLPTRIYARPLELYVGRAITREEMLTEIDALGYRIMKGAAEPGTFARSGNRWHIHSRKFDFGDGEERARHLTVRTNGSSIVSVEQRGEGSVAIARLDPPLLASIYPDSNEDRDLVALEDAPGLLIAGLLAVEDRRFRDHSGVDFRSLARALAANVKAGAVTQGGSTITQQLIKNLFLTRDQTIVRKANEALMALLIETHLDKDEVLELYLNEVYLAQQGRRAIHGFGLGARHFFDKSLEQLNPAEIALLIGIIKGPTYYNPRRHPDRALNRRNLVLQLMSDFDVLADVDVAKLKEEPLGVTDEPPRVGGRFGDFADLVKRQLSETYREEDLKREGLVVMTTLDPQVQAAAQAALDAQLSDELQGAVVVIQPDNGEILGLIGGRSSAVEGFNRAIDARRQVGSVFKPFVYLEALNHPQRYTLATIVDDSKFTLATRQGDWTPENFDGQYNGELLLIEALARSLNAATARLGEEVGMDRVFELVRSFGIDPPGRPNPSSALGAVELTPIEVAQLYQVIASGGFPTPVSSVRDVLDRDGEPLKRFPARLGQIEHPESTYLLTRGLREVAASGTARSLSRYLPADLQVAGKTGTTNDGRDAWFAGFSGDRLAVVWVGRDDNQPTDLTGSSGALPVFGRLMGNIETTSLDLVAPPGIQSYWIDPLSGKKVTDDCDVMLEIPFIQGSEPLDYAACVRDHRDDRRFRERRSFWDRIFGP